MFEILIVLAVWLVMMWAIGYYATRQDPNWPDWANFRCSDYRDRIRYFQNEPDLVDAVWIDYMDGAVMTSREVGEPGVWIDARPKGVKEKSTTRMIVEFWVNR